MYLLINSLIGRFLYWKRGLKYKQQYSKTWRYESLPILEAWIEVPYASIKCICIYVASYTGSVDWSKNNYLSLIHSFKSLPILEAWIEVCVSSCWLISCVVASYTGSVDWSPSTPTYCSISSSSLPILEAWIEVSYPAVLPILYRSLPILEAWIEVFCDKELQHWFLVASYTGSVDWSKLYR